jgi:hypothetical protein
MIHRRNKSRVKTDTRHIAKSDQNNTHKPDNGGYGMDTVIHREKDGIFLMPRMPKDSKDTNTGQDTTINTRRLESKSSPPAEMASMTQTEKMIS